MAFIKVSKNSSKIHGIIGSYFIKEVSVKKRYWFLFIIMLYESLCFGQEYFEELFSSESRIKGFQEDSTGVMYLATRDCLFKSVDNGSSWQQIFDEAGVETIGVNSLDCIYALSYPPLLSMHYSIDQGLTWNVMNRPTGYDLVDLFITSDDTMFLTGWGCIYKYDSDNEDWVQVLACTYEEIVTSIVSNENNVLFASSTNFEGSGTTGGIYRSDDRGDTWEHIGLDYYFVQDLTINSNGEFFACTSGHSTTGDTVIMHSIDQGETWNQCFSYASQMFTIINDSNDNLYVGTGNYPISWAGVQFSQDNGQTWNQLQTNLIPNNAQVDYLYCDSDNYLYAIVNGDYPPYTLLKSLEPTTTTVIDEDFVAPVNQISNYPNPFTDETTIVLRLPSKSIREAKVEIFNVRGQKIREIPVEQQEVKWDGRDDQCQKAPSGVYFYRIKTEDSILTKKCILMK